MWGFFICIKTINLLIVIIDLSLYLGEIMSTEKQDTTENTETEELDAMEEMEDEGTIDLIKDLLDNLVPPTEVKIVDLYGNEYELRTKIAARSQIKLIRKFEEVTKELSFAQFFDADEEINSRSMINAIVKMTIKEEIMDAIEVCFGIAHPRALQQAIGCAASDEYAPKNPKALDLFGLEDILSAILPLFLGLIKKGANALTLLAQ